MKLFVTNLKWYFVNWRDNFSDYVDDLLQIAANELENREQEELFEKMQVLIDTARMEME